jgi:hypothetical protein
MVRKWVGRVLALAAIIFVMIVTNKYFNTNVKAYHQAQAEQRAIWDEKKEILEKQKQEESNNKDGEKKDSSSATGESEKPAKKDYEPSEATGDDFYIDLSDFKLWESGVFSEKTGEKEDNKRRLRYPKLIEEDCPKYNIVLTEGYKLYICEYDADKQFIRCEALSGGEVYEGSKGGAYFSVTLRRVDKEKSLSYGNWNAIFEKGFEAKICTDKNLGFVPADDSQNKEKVAVKYDPPSKVLVIGNSITSGFGTHGMASSDVDTDYYYLVNQYLIGLVPNVEMNRISGKGWEQSTSSEERTRRVDGFLADSFTADTDLVIVQLGDNVSSKEELATFPEDCVYLLQSIKKINPNARVLWVFGRYHIKNSKTIQSACDECGAEFVDVTIISTDEKYSASVGDKYIDSKGRERVIEKPGVASHPNDLGMKTIADIIINQLNY